MFFKFKKKNDNTAVVETSNEKSGGAILQVLKGSIFAVFITVVSILLFALIIKLTNLPTAVIKPVNQVIKIVSVLIGTIFAFRKDKTQGLFKGILIGLVYTLLSFLVFSALDGSFNIKWSILNDLLFSGIAGAISGIIAVNIGKKNR